MTNEEKAADTALRNEIDTEGYKKPGTARRSLWINDDTWRRMNTAAKKDNRSISGWIRAVIGKALTKK